MKRNTIILAILFFLIAATVMISPKISAPNAPTPLTEEEVQEKYSCNRMTTDVRDTDIYCRDYEKYLKDFNNNELINY